MRLVGATVVDGSQRIASHLRLDSPVTLLYGVNGSGKTTVLNCLARLFGEDPDWKSPYVRGLDGLYFHVDEGLERLSPIMDDHPVSPATTALVFANHFPRLAQEFEPNVVAAELHGGALVHVRTVLDEPSFAYVDDEAPVLASVRRRLDDRYHGFAAEGVERLRAIRNGDSDDRRAHGCARPVNSGGASLSHRPTDGQVGMATADRPTIDELHLRSVNAEQDQAERSTARP